MHTSWQPLHMDQPATYRIVVQGRLDESWSDSLAGMRVVAESPEGAPAITTLTGRLPDQAALFGLLARVRDLAVPLLLVECLEVEER